MSENTDSVLERRFEDLGLSESSLAAIKRKGFESPTKIQAEVIPRLLAGKNDVIAQSHTGTGKTAAFGLPLIQVLEPKKGPVQALILTPTRELAVQVAEEINSLRGSKALHVVPVYGGQSYELQFRHLRQGIDILVGTPGRIIDHLNRASLKLDQVRWVVLDEADEMLDMGFIDDIEAILGTCSKERRMLLFSATIPQRIRAMADTWMNDIVEVSIKTSALTSAQTEQTYMEVLEQDKFEALCRIVDVSSDFYGIVFGRTKVECDNIHRRLLERGYDAEVLHGDINQTGREKVLESFRRKHVDILVATDVAARGIDVEALTHVINYSLPTDSESYVHRIGRTGRAGREGRAVTFITPSEFRKLSMIQRLSRTPIKRDRPPRVDEILGQKRQRIFDELNVAIAKIAGDQETLDLSTVVPEVFQVLSSDIVNQIREKGLDFTHALSCMLHSLLADELDASRYGKVTELQPGGPTRGSRPEREGSDTRGRFERGFRGAEGQVGGVRLWIARGKADGFGKSTLVEFIRSGSGVRDRDINQVEVHEHYSFITVPPEESTRVIHAFIQAGKDGKPVVRPADTSEMSRDVRKPVRKPHGASHGGERGFSDRFHGDRRGAPGKKHR